MHIGAIIQARMTSRRLPGKVLLKIQGKAVLHYLLERIERCSSLETIIVATSDHVSDDEIAAFCKSLDIKCFRGNLNNVADRFNGAAAKYKLDAFVRICGDSPLLDTLLVDELVQIFRRSDADLVTNVANRTFPHGQSVEVLSTETLCHAVKKMDLPQHFEHVTRYFYDHCDDFVIKEIKCPIVWEGASFVIDTPADFKRIKALIESMDRPHLEYSLRDLIRLDCELRDFSKQAKTARF